MRETPRLSFTERPTPSLAWAGQGSCRAHPDPDLWFAAESDTTRRQQAEAICRTCPVAAECLRYALAVPGIDGIWAATTPRQRTRIRNRTPKPVPPPRKHAA